VSASPKGAIVLDARPSAASADADFRAFVGDSRFPCLGGASVVRRRKYQLHVYGMLGSAASARPLARDLDAFVRDTPEEGGTPRAFVAVFPRRPPATEHAFERRLWTQLQRLHDRDDPAAGWDPTVSADPDDPRFSFSFAGRAFFVVGLHSRSSRLARRFRWPALVFNPHAQFERLRAEGRYARFQAVIRERDLAFQGTANPNLSDFGERSEARQYSGRAAEPLWRCPFHRRLP
jgi:FPC/CPF motif-containing protein YcgG